MVKHINKHVYYVSTCEFQVDIVFLSRPQVVLMKMYVGSNTTRAHIEVRSNILYLLYVCDHIIQRGRSRRRENFYYIKMKTTICGDIILMVQKNCLDIITLL